MDDFGANQPLRLDRRLRRALGGAYRRSLRRALPERAPVLYSGVRVADRRLGDALVPRHWRPELVDDIADYEYALMQGLARAVRPCDVVVVVGGGLGVTAAEAARLAGEAGRVVCYEGSPVQARRVAETAALNGVGARVRVVCATVGADVGVYRRAHESSAPLVAPADLPDCDVLELDCEGAELQILQQMRVKPRAVLVECHGRLGAPPRAVRAQLQALGYDVEDLGVAEPRLRALCEADDVRVLIGERVS